MSFTVLQQYEIEDGYQKGLTKQQVDLYAKEEFNYLKMSYFKNALIDGVTLEELQPILNKEVDEDSIRLYLKELKEGKTPEVLTVTKQEVKKELPKPVVLIVTIVFCVIASIVMLPENESYIEFYETIEIPLHEDVNPVDLIYEKVLQEGDELEMPRSIDTNQTGHFLIPYKIHNNENVTTYYAYITVVDQEPPVLKLICNELNLIEGSMFDPISYLKEAYDNEDGDLKEDVVCSLQDINPSTQKCVYTVSDRSGNTSSETLLIHYVPSLEYVKQVMDEEE